MADNNDGPGFVTGLLLGTALGAAISILLAPRPGHETREQLLEKGSELKGVADVFTAQARERVDEVVAQAKAAMGEERQSLSEAINDMREVLREATLEAKEVMKEALDQGKEATAKATSDLQERLDQARRRES